MVLFVCFLKQTSFESFHLFVFLTRPVLLKHIEQMNFVVFCLIS